MNRKEAVYEKDTDTQSDFYSFFICDWLHYADSVTMDAYEIIGLNQKSLINQGLDWLRPIFLTQKEAMKMSIRRFYEQRRKSAA